MEPRAGLSQISYLFETLRHYRIKANGEVIESKSYNDPGETYTALWQALYNDRTQTGRISEKQYRRYLALAYASDATREQLGKELEKLINKGIKK